MELWKFVSVLGMAGLVASCAYRAGERGIVLHPQKPHVYYERQQQNPSCQAPCAAEKSPATSPKTEHRSRLVLEVEGKRLIYVLDSIEE